MCVWRACKTPSRHSPKREGDIKKTAELGSAVSIVIGITKKIGKWQWLGLSLSNEELSGGYRPTIFGGKPVEKHSCRKVMSGQSESGTGIGLIKKISAYQVVQFQPEAGRLHTGYFESGAFVKGIGIHFDIGVWEIGINNWYEQETILRAHGMESLVRENRSIKIKIDSSAVKDFRFARYFRLLGHTEFHVTFICAATLWE